MYGNFYGIYKRATEIVALKTHPPPSRPPPRSAAWRGGKVTGDGFGLVDGHGIWMGNTWK